jgi:hypothetical protein
MSTVTSGCPAASADILRERISSMGTVNICPAGELAAKREEL